MTPAKNKMTHHLYTDPPHPRQIWQHFKGSRYEIIGLFKHSETQELMVGYIKEGADPEDTVAWVRPASMWNDKIERETYEGPRLKLVD